LERGRPVCDTIPAAKHGDGTNPSIDLRPELSGLIPK